MHLSTLSEWLAWIASVHTTEIELGLDRVKKVAEILNILTPSCLVIIVGGTNGKGSTVAGLDAIYRKAGYRVGTFTTPILFKHNEEVRINGKEASDEAFCHAFAAIEAVRGDVPLTPFEFHTLAALIIFKQHSLDVLILEVGLGGRLDAVNIIDADVAIVTSIGIDHVEWLGSTREEIAREKAGIFRHKKPAICGDFDPPNTLIDSARKLDSFLVCQNKDFFFNETSTTWSWHYQNIQYDHLPLNALATQNMSTVLMAITLLQDSLPVTYENMKKGLLEIKLIGRIQVMNGPITTIFDVSHNPDSVALLTKQLEKMHCNGKTHAVFSMLMDKDMVESLKMIQGTIDDWYIAPLPVKRGRTAEKLKQAFDEAHIHAVTLFPSIREAYDIAKNKAKPGDRIVVFGSFHTVAEVMAVSGFN